jgi:predicted DNA-binding transcriptional regulator AlpA
MTDLETMNIRDLAKLLHKAPSTIATEVTKSPQKLPPRLRLPDNRKVLWLKKDVESWINEHRQQPT